MELLNKLTFYEFFSGGGMARIGLGKDWTCLFANDFDETKADSYRENFNNAPEFVPGDVRKVTPEQLPSHANLAWASFPCQDLSLAGSGAGLAGHRSGVFWPFWDLMLSLKSQGRNPPIIALENVSGLVTSHGGNDLAAIITSMAQANYRVGALLLDGAYFTPQSRLRLFIVAVSRGVPLPKGLVSRVPIPAWHSSSLQNVINSLPPKIRRSWIWWKLPMPTKEAPHIIEIIESEPVGVSWHSQEETNKLLRMMTPNNLAKVKEAQKDRTLQIGTIYKRTRSGVQRAEVRFDGLSGCLRTPAGGSSRQIIMVVEGENIRTRLISPRETARLMGLPEDYILPNRYNDAYHLTGDGIVVPSVSWIETYVIKPIALAEQLQRQQKVNTEAELWKISQ